VVCRVGTEGRPEPLGPPSGDNPTGGGSGVGTGGSKEVGPVGTTGGGGTASGGCRAETRTGGSGGAAGAPNEDLGGSVASRASSGVTVDPNPGGSANPEVGGPADAGTGGRVGAGGGGAGEYGERASGLAPDEPAPDRPGAVGAAGADDCGVAPASCSPVDNGCTARRYGS
jgi:hypothetical protein